MAYMGRGGFSSFGGGLEPNDNKNYERKYRRGRVFCRYYYIPLDNTYVIFEMIAAIIIFTIAGVTFLATYKPSVVDPIEDTKRTIINTYIIITLSLVVLTILANYFSKDKNSLIKRLMAILSLSIITILAFWGIKANMDSIYTKSKFEQIYTQEYGEQKSDAKTKFNIGLTGMKMKTEKEYYVDECAKAYNIFGIRTYGIIALNILLIILLIYQISKVSQIQEKRDRLSKDDAILFDEQENVKF